MANRWRKDLRLGAVIVAAGSGVRFGGGKLFVSLTGRPLICTTLEAFCDVPLAAVALVCRSEDRQRLLACIRRTALPRSTRVILVSGGMTRAESVRNGVEALLDEGAVSSRDYVLIHDGARPLVSRGLLERVLAPTLEPLDVRVPCLPVVDSLRRRTSAGTETVDRRTMVSIQTPQLCRIEALQRAYLLLPNIAPYGDEAALISASGGTVGLIEGEARNMKITVPEDLTVAEALLMPTLHVITGFGYDAHRFAIGRPLLLGGVRIPFHEGLEGTSDADVVLHALMDAILGCAGAGDIGALFPSSDSQYAGISSSILLQRVLADRRVHELRLCSADMTIVAEKPRLAAYQTAIRKRLAELLGLPAVRINVKVTGNDTIGWIGHGEGIAALCVVNALRRD